MIGVNVFPDYSPVCTAIDDKQLRLTFSGNEFIDISVHILEALKRDSGLMRRQLEAGDREIDISKREFYALLNALYPDDSWNVVVDEIELISLAEYFKCDSLLKKLIQNLKVKIEKLELSDINAGLRLSRPMQGVACLEELVNKELAQFFGEVYLSYKTPEERWIALSTFNECKVRAIEFLEIEQEQLDDLYALDSLRWLNINNGGQLERLNRLPQYLTHFSLNKSFKVADFRLPSDLNTLSLKSCFWVNDDFVQSLPRKINTLTLESPVSNLSEDVFDSLPDGITYLCLIGMKMSDRGLARLPRELSHFECIFKFTNFTGAGIKNLPPKLLSLHLYGMEKIQDEDLKLLPATLQILELHECTLMSEEGLRHLVNLRSLTLDGRWQIIKKGITFLTKLEVLQITFCIRFSQIEMFPNSLRQLTLIQCDIDPGDFLKLPKGIQRLIVINSRLTKEHYDCISPDIAYVELNGEIMRG